MAVNRCNLGMLASMALLLTTSAALAQDNGWKDYGGVTLRRNDGIARTLSGYSWVYLSSYNGGAGGGMATQHRMTFCANRSVIVHSESSVSMGVDGAFGNSSSREDDEGGYEVLEDRAGNTVLHMSLRKNGEKYMRFLLAGSKMHAEQNLTFTRYQRVC